MKPLRNTERGPFTRSDVFSRTPDILKILSILNQRPFSVSEEAFKKSTSTENSLIFLMVYEI